LVVIYNYTDDARIHECQETIAIKCENFKKHTKTHSVRKCRVFLMLKYWVAHKQPLCLSFICLSVANPYCAGGLNKTWLFPKNSCAAKMLICVT